MDRLGRYGVLCTRYMFRSASRRSILWQRVISVAKWCFFSSSLLVHWIIHPNEWCNSMSLFSILLVFFLFVGRRYHPFLFDWCTRCQWVFCSPSYAVYRSLFIRWVVDMRYVRIRLFQSSSIFFLLKKSAHILAIYPVLYGLMPRIKEIRRFAIEHHPFNERMNKIFLPIYNSL